MTFRSTMVALAITLAVTVAAIGNPVAFVDRMTQQMLDQEAQIAKFESDAAAVGCSKITDPCVGKGESGKYPDEQSLVAMKPMRASFQANVASSSSGQVPPAVAGALMLILAVAAIVVLVVTTPRN